MSQIRSVIPASVRRWSAWDRWLTIAITLAIAVVIGLPLSAATSDYNIEQSPMYLGKTEPPLMMLVMSRDEQLFNKAYSDYTDLDGDGRIDTTYNDGFDYAGYFDSHLCYSYASSVFKASAVASGGSTDANGNKILNHQCSGSFSGNFLNWVAMSRLDLVRWVLYGGTRSTDTIETTTCTGSGRNQKCTTSAADVVLERAYIPNDLHAWVKTYSKDDIGKYTPYTSATSFCSASFSGTPQIRVASGTYTEWASTAGSQCNTGSGDNPGSLKATLIARVDVCGNSDETLRESFCRSYSDGTHTYYRPAGLLQQYGESGRLRFGLISGSYDQPRAGGVLRRNIGLFAGNSTTVQCATGDEVNTNDGRFCWKINSATVLPGIVRTVDNFKIDKWSGSVWSDCNNYGILNRQVSGANGYLNDPGGSGGKPCSAWGNPIAEMYAEALRYIAHDASGVPATFGTSTSVDTALGLPTNVSWTDPYSTNSYCASCSILVLSSGLPSFDANAVPAVKQFTSSVAALTNTVGQKEGINGTSVFVGRDQSQRPALADTYADYCQAVSLSGLGNALGICPDSPSTEGSYLVAGLAHAAATTDLRPDLVGGSEGKTAAYKNTVTTYAVQMAESLPSFEIPVGGGTITLSPLCQANNSGSANANSSGWRTCSLGDVAGGPTTASVSPYYVYGRDLKYSGNNLVSGSYKLVWEDSLWGNDHDNDLVTMMSFCVGSECSFSGTGGGNICWRSNSTACSSTTVASNEVLVRVEILSAYAGNALLTGFTVTGSNNDGTKRDLLRPGNNDGSIITTSANPSSSWGTPVVYRFTAGSGSVAKVLQNPLWYAAKYGNPKDLDATGTPVAGKWDSKTSGEPDGYFLAHDPTELKSRLEEIFESAAAAKASVSGSASSPSVESGTFSVSASFSAGDNNDWIGDVVATSTKTGSTLWSAGTQMASTLWSERNIVASWTPTTVDATTGTVTQAVSAGEFTSTNVPGGTTTAQFASLGLKAGDAATSSWLGTQTVADLVNYLKGQSNGNFRTRSSPLGDIVNSTPVIALPTDDYGWGSSWSSETSLSGLATTYKQFLTSKAGRVPAVYVGANDGMVHAFNGSTSGTSGGKELFAYIPSSSWRHMGELANPSYSHRYFVDGPVRLSDAYFGSAWHTVLVGSTGAGGAATTNADTLPQGSVFGLDVTDPTSFGSSKVLWELSGRNDADLGQVLGTSLVVPVKTATGARFVTIFGNGANSSNGNAVLYVVDVATGAVIRKLSANAATYGGHNGIINVAAAALSNTLGLADTLYAGDLQGHLWKFDLSSANPADWSIALGGSPLFSAVDPSGAAQPITGQILLNNGPSGGVMVYFGTGRYFVSGDASSLQVQSLYGIWDNLSTAVAGRGSLVGQTMASTTSANSYETRSVSSNTVNYVSNRGWYVDLAANGVAAGERFIGTPYLLNGVVYFATYTPTEGSDCAGGGENWEYGLGTLTGAGSLSGLTDEHGNTVCTGDCGGIKVNDSSTAGGSNTVAPITTVGWLRDKTTETEEVGACTIVNVAGGTTTGLTSSTPCGRQSWRQLR